jgi:methionyl-tRNA formyltransferase
MKIILLADSRVGLGIAKWLIEKYREDIGLVVTMGENEIAAISRAACLPVTVFESSQALFDFSGKQGLEFDLGILAWWPKLIRSPLLTMPKCGFVNTHPSLLPHGRGKHYNFWTIVEEAPFGVSLHVVDEKVDNGAIVAQAAIPYSWEDTGASLYDRALEAMERLFKETYPSLRSLEFPRQPQDLTQGSFHRAAEIDAASIIPLDKRYTARDLLNLLRARTFPGFPACSFTSDEGDVFEVRVDIRRKQT